jgi:small subunit ribosomal protein S8
MFASINNGQLAKRNFIVHKKKKICEKFLDVLWNEGFILGYKNCFQKTKTGRINNVTKVLLKYKNGKPVINKIKLVTKPSRRIYYTNKQIWKMKTNETFIIFSTNKGLKTLDECQRLKIGGEPYIVLN